MNRPFALAWCINLSLLATSITNTATDFLFAPRIHEVLTKTKPRDAQILLNFAYWSYARSHCTLQAQKIVLNQLQTSWLLWQNCIQTRLNPSKELPYPGCTSLKAMAGNTALRKQKITNATYAQLLESVCKESLLENQQARDLVDALRTEARLQITQSLWNSMTHMQQELATAQHAIESSTQAFNTAHKNFITAGITALLENFGVSSFAAFDQSYNHNSDVLFQALYGSQTLFNQVWEELETQRAQFFAQTFTTMRDAMIELKFPRKSFLCMFGPDGVLPQSQQVVDLAAASIHKYSVDLLTTNTHAHADH